MKLTTITHVSVDGVMQGLGGATEDRRGGFERGGWAGPLFDNEATTFLIQAVQRADAFLFGRWTYETFAGSRGAMEGMRQSPIGGALNSKPKHRPRSPTRNGRKRRSSPGDVAKAIGELKAKPAGELQVHGSGSLVRWLFDNQLVDEITLLTYPVVLGQGTRLFPDTGPDTALELVESRSTPSGVIIQCYRLGARPQYATATPT
jgi:dihydrofolate reductase